MVNPHVVQLTCSECDALPNGTCRNRRRCPLCVINHHSIKAEPWQQRFLSRMLLQTRVHQVKDELWKLDIHKNCGNCYNRPSQVESMAICKL